MVVADPRGECPDDDDDDDARREDQAGAPAKPRQPRILARQDRHDARRDQDASPVEHHEARGQDREAGEGAQQHATPGDPAEFADGLEVGEQSGEERQRQRRGRRQVADGDVGGRVQERRADAEALPPGVFVAHHPQDAVIAHADEHDGERRREDVEVADGERQPAERPGGADEQCDDREDRVIDAAVDDEEEQRDADDRQPGGEPGVGLGGDHLIRLEDGQARQPDFEVGELGVDLGGDDARRPHAAQGGGETAGFLDRAREEEAERPVTGEEVMRLRQHVFLRCVGTGHTAPRTLIGGGVLDAGAGRADDGGELRQEALVLRRGRGGKTGDALLRLLDHGVQAQRVPTDRAAIQETLHVGEMVVVDRLDLLARREHQGTALQVAEIDFVEDAVERLGLIGQACGEAVECSLHPGAVGPLDHDNDVVIVAELAEVALPALLIVLARTDEVVASGVILEAQQGGDERGNAGKQGKREDEARTRTDPIHEAHEGEADEGRPPARGRRVVIAVGGEVGHPVFPGRMGTPVVRRQWRAADCNRVGEWNKAE